MNKQKNKNEKMKILNGFIFVLAIIGFFAFASVINMQFVKAEDFGNCLTDYEDNDYNSPDEYCADWYGGSGDVKCIDRIGQCASCEDAGIPDGYALNDEVWNDGGTSSGTCMWCNNGEVVVTDQSDCEEESCTADEYFTDEDGECMLCSFDGTSSDPADDSSVCDYGCDDDSTCQFGEYCDLESPAGQYAGQCTVGCNELDSNCDSGSTEPICGGDDVCVGCSTDSECEYINGGTCGDDGSCTLDENWDGCTGFWGGQIGVDEYEDTPCWFMGYESDLEYASKCLGNDEWDDSSAEGVCAVECNEGDKDEYACDGSEGNDYVWAECVNGVWDSSSGYSNYADSCSNNGCDWDGQTFPEGDYPAEDCGDGTGNTYTLVCSAGEWDWSNYNDVCAGSEGCEDNGVYYDVGEPWTGEGDICPAGDSQQYAWICNSNGWSDYLCSSNGCEEGATERYNCDNNPDDDGYVWAECVNGVWDTTNGWDNYYAFGCGSEGEGYCGDDICSDYEWGTEWCAYDCDALYCATYPDDAYCGGSGGGDESYCGDGVCDYNEDCDSCEDDCWIYCD